MKEAGWLIISWRALNNQNFIFLLTMWIAAISSQIYLHIWLYYVTLFFLNTLTGKRSLSARSLHWYFLLCLSFWLSREAKIEVYIYCMYKQLILLGAHQLPQGPKQLLSLVMPWTGPEILNKSLISGNRTHFKGKIHFPARH